MIRVAPFFSPLNPLPPSAPLPPAFPSPLSSCPWVVYISYLAFPLPILFLASLCLFCTYQLYFLFPAPFPSLSPLPLYTDNPPCDLHFFDSLPVLVVLSLLFLFF